MEVIDSGFDRHLTGYSLGAWRSNNLLRQGAIKSAVTLSLPVFAFPAAGSLSACHTWDAICGGGMMTTIRPGTIGVSSGRSGPVDFISQDHAIHSAIMDGAVAMMPRLFFVLIFSGLLAGCASSVESDLVSQCGRMVFDQKLWRGREDGSVGKYIITPVNHQEVFWKKEEAGIIDAGTRFVVESVIRDWNGSYGNYFRVVVKILDGPFGGVVTDVPVHAPYHPSPSWVNYTLDSDRLRLDPFLVEDC